MFVDLGFKEFSLSETISSLADSLDFDAISVMGNTPSNQLLFEIMSYNNVVDENLLQYCIGLSELFKREKKALLVDREFTYDNEMYSKYDNSNAFELYIPIFNEKEDSESVAGIVYLASKSQKELKVLDNHEFNEFIFRVSSMVISLYYSAKEREGLFQIAYMLVEITDIKEPYLIGRLFNIAYWCEEIAKEMGLPQIDIEKLQIATLMHDLGKIYISEEILNKEGELTDEEYKIIKKRVVYSSEITKKLEMLYDLSDLPDIILNYQERIDGKGYPYGRKGNEIPLLSRILGVAKAISSMLTNTSYRMAKTLEEVIDELQKNSGTQFDKAVVKVAVAVLVNERKCDLNCISDMGSFATLNIKVINHRLKEETLNLWGNIRREKEKYIFAPVTKLFNHNKLKIISSKLYVDFTDKIVHYALDISNIEEDKIEISNLEIEDDAKTLTIKWSMPALLVTPSRNVYNITVIAIGGRYIDFYAFQKDSVEEIAEGVIQIIFDDGSKVALPGITLSRENIDHRILFRLKYIDVNEKDMRIVYSQLFKKQIEMKSIISKNKS